MPNTLRSAQLRHQIYQQRFSSSVVLKVIRLLNAADADLAQQLLTRLPDVGSLTSQRLESVLADIRSLNYRAYKTAEARIADELRQYSAYEIEFQVGTVSKYLPVGANFTAPPVSLVAQAVTTDPLKGKLLSEWTDELSEAKYRRVRDTLRIGIVEGQTTQQMVSRIRGTRAAGYGDGLMEIDRRAAQAFVRTAVNDIGSKARMAVFAENDGIVEGVQWVATLDDRTCPTCAPLDGEVYALDEGPRPPRHIGCRCTIIPVMKPEFDLLEGGTRASRGGDGPEQVPATQTYQTWLSKQSASFQDETLGPTRGALFRRGDLSVDRFVNRNGDLLTLAELRVREAAAFRAANVGQI